MSDEFLFADDQPSSTVAAYNQSNKWIALIVDDEPDVHRITRIVLANFEFDGRKLEFLSAYSGAEAKQIMAEHDDIALILLDVVMESDHAGLEVARYVREDLGNNYSRIVLRTGQPGQAPEHKVIRDYDINDYKDKTELTTTKLNTLMYATLRSYRDICVLNEHRLGLEKVIKASAEVSASGNIKNFASAVLGQITNLLHLEASALYCSNSPRQSNLLDIPRFRVLAATGDLEECNDFISLEQMPETVQHGFQQALANHQSQFFDDHYVGYFTSERGSESLLYVKYSNPLNNLDRQLLEVYATNVAISYENLLMHEEVIETQREVLYLLGEAVELRSQETGAHVKRVAQISRILAHHYGLSEDESNHIKMASPMHDTGKIAIPDQILNKPGKLTDEEFAIMKTHASAGEAILSKSDRPILKLAAKIAGQHHERWDGKGYPHGLKGEEIHIAGRITAVADVFDALGSKRCYKEPWPLEKIIELFKQEAGQQFDPKLVDILLAQMDTIVAVRERFPD